MAKLDILRYPDPKLQTVAKPVQAVDARIQTLIADMLETMYDANGIGLAATHSRTGLLEVWLVLGLSLLRLLWRALNRAPPPPPGSGQSEARAQLQLVSLSPTTSGCCHLEFR